MFNVMRVHRGSKGIYVCYTIIRLRTGAKRYSCMHACDWMHCIHDKQAFECTARYELHEGPL